MEVQDIINDLERKYNRIIDLPNKPFYIGIIKYVNFVLNTPVFEPIVKKLKSELSSKFASQEQKFISDGLYDDELPNKPLSTEKKKERALFLHNELKSLRQKQKQFEYSIRKLQTEPHYAWLKILTLWESVYDRETWTQQNTDDKGKPKNYSLVRFWREVDEIIEAKENFGDFEDNFDREYDNRRNRNEQNREFLIRSDYLNYFTLVNEYLIDWLKKSYKNQVVNFPVGTQVKYENGSVYFKLGDGTTDDIDLKSARELKKVFECFWELKKRNPNNKSFSSKEVIDIYHELFGVETEIDRHTISSALANLRRTKLKNKPNLKNRFKIDFNKNTQNWDLLLE